MHVYMSVYAYKWFNTHSTYAAMVELRDLRDVLQPKQFFDSMIYIQIYKCTFLYIHMYLEITYVF